MALGEMAWQWPIWIDLWAAGMAGGVYLVAFLAYRFSGGKYKNTFRLAVYAGVPLAVIGVLLLIIDLGTPIWFWHLFTSFDPIAVMSMGTWILMIWIPIVLLMVALWWLERRASVQAAATMEKIAGFLGWIGAILAALLMTYTGVLLSATTQPIWATTPLFPALFVASAVSTGVAWLIFQIFIVNRMNRSSSPGLHRFIDLLFGSSDWKISSNTVVLLAKTLALVTVLQIVVLAGYAIWLGVSSVLGASDALALLTTGSLAIPFWVGIVLVGLLVPLLLLLTKWGKELEVKGVTAIIVTSASLTLIGGLVLRAVMVVGGQL